MMKINTNYYAILREARSYASMSNVGVTFERVKDEDIDNYVPRAEANMRTGAKTIFLSHPEPWWSDEQIIRWRAAFYHELGHFSPEVVDDYDIAKEKGFDGNSVLGLGYNCLCDYRQEKNNLGMYTGRDEMLSKGQAMGVKAIIDTHGDKLATVGTESDGGVLSTLMAMSTFAREEWQRDVSGMGEALKEKFSPQMQELMVKSKEYIERLDECETAAQLYQLLRDMMEHLFNRDPDEEEQKAKDQAEQGEGEGDQQEGSGGESQAGKGGGEDGEGEGEGEHGKGDGDKDGEQSDGKINWKDLTLNKHDDEDAKESNASLTIDYDDYYSNDDFRCADPDKLKVRNYENNTGGAYPEPSSQYTRRVAGKSVHTGLSNKIRKLLQVKTQTLRVNGMKRGKLSAKNIHRATMGVDVGQYRERVFSQKVQKFDLDTAVSVLIDFSGSMGGSKMEHAIVSGVMLNDAVGKLGVPIELLGFTENSHTGAMSILKTFNKGVSNAELSERMCRAANSMGSNADGEAILFAHDRLARQPNKRKVLIVLSDGQPASGRGDVYQFTKDTVANIEKQGRIEIYGIGIEDNAVKGIYKHNQTIRNSSELESAVLNVVKNHILK